MPFLDLAAVLLVLTAALSYVNFRLLRLPPAIGLTALTLLASLAVIALGWVFPAVTAAARGFAARINFGPTLLHGMLGFLLFAASLQVDLADLARRKRTITALSTAGVVLSTALVGVLMWDVFCLLGVSIRFVDCLLFGALISPTDPIAVLAILKRLGAPRTIEATIAGESLFNDGVGVVMFTALLEAAQQGRPAPGPLALLFLREAVGGAALGLAAGLAVFWLLKSVDDYKVEVLLTVALAAGGFALADAVGASGPIAMVVAGLVVGNQGRRFAMSARTADRMDQFWELVDEALNAVLFVMVGLEVLVVPFRGRYLLAGLAAVPVVLLARLTSVAAPVWVISRWFRYERHTVRILVWGGLRGSISLAMALSLPSEPGKPAAFDRDLILVVTYVVVAFSILVQGLTIGPLTRRWLAWAPAPQGGRPE